MSVPWDVGKLVLKLVDDGGLRRAQILSRIHQRLPNEANDQASAGHQRVPSVMTKRGQENNEQREPVRRIFPCPATTF
jgi:hypothetical protein